MSNDNSDISLRTHITFLLQNITTTVSKLFSLAALECRLAGISLMTIIGLVITTILLVFSSWIALMVAAAIWLTSWHIALSTSLLIIGLINIFLIFPVTLLIKRFFQKLLFPATRRQIKASAQHITGVTP